MATTGNGRTPYESGGAGENPRKRRFQPEMDEEPENVSQQAGQYNSSGVSEVSTHQGGNSAASGISELEQMLKRMAFTRSETQHLIALLHSTTIEESPSDKFHAPIISSRVVEEQIASPSELANTYKGSTIGTGQAPIPDSNLINNNAPMASPQHPATMENLPDELLVNIFIRLLAKQLAQMRSVSKSWNGLLSKSSFVKSHLNRSIHNNDQILLHFSAYEPSVGFELPVNPHLRLTNSIKCPPNPQSQRETVSVIGSVNGLICSCYGDSIIQIWNPSLSAVFKLPHYSMPPYSDPSDAYDSMKVCFRFGFDPKTDDYKVVKLTGFGEPPDNNILWWMDVEIYSMRKGVWELIAERFPSHIKWIDEKEVVCVDGHDGHLHWLGCTKDVDVDSNTIVAFDLGSYTFSEIPLPHSIAVNNYHGLKSLGVLAGKLCLMSWDDDEACVVWVMEEYGIAESWVKRHVFSQFSGDTYPFGFTSANKFLIQDDYYCQLVLYDLVTEQAQILKNDCDYELYGAGKIVEYVDSLVWVAPVKH